MSLEEIQRVLKKEDLQLVENILIKKREQVFAQIRQLRIQRDAITGPSPASSATANPPRRA